MVGDARALEARSARMRAAGSRVTDRSPRRDLAWLGALLLLAAGPFAGRPFHIDEPVYVWCARWIAEHPFDFYGFSFNWTGEGTPAYESNENPPLSSYAMALLARLTGWGEWSLHLGFLLAGLAAVAGTYALARPMSRRPQVAACAAMFCPAFLATSHLANSDMAMVALFVAAIAAWRHGAEGAAPAWLWAAGVLAALAVLTKYFALALLPLLAVDAAVRRLPWRHAVGALAVPLAALVAYHLATTALYGESLVLGAARYAAGYRGAHGVGALAQSVLGLTFLGGCAAAVGLLAPALRPARAGVAAVAAVGTATGLASLVVALGPGYPDGATSVVAVQIGLWAGVGAGVLWLALDELRRWRDPDALLLALWVLGTAFFTTFVNWTTNGRTVLPLLPAVGILIARRLDRVAGLPGDRTGRLAAGLVAAALLSLAVVWADVRFAQASRTAAERLVPAARSAGAGVWFQGHWGFQYYSEPLGARALDRSESRVARGDVVLVPEVNSYLFALPAEAFARRDVLALPQPRWIATMSRTAGAGFYAATYGPLPFAFGRGSPARFAVYEATSGYDFALGRRVGGR